MMIMYRLIHFRLKNTSLLEDQPQVALHRSECQIAAQYITVVMLPSIQILTFSTVSAKEEWQCKKESIDRRLMVY